MKSIFVGLLLFFSFLHLSQALGEIAKLQELTEKSDKGLIVLDKAGIKEFLMSKRSPDYTFFLILNVAENCETCAHVESYFEAVAEAYRKAQAHMQPKPIFFGVLYYDMDSRPIFEKWKIQTAPIIIGSSKSILPDQLPMMDTWYFTPSTVYDREKVLEYINVRTQKKITLQVSFLESIKGAVISLAIIGILLSILIFARDIIKSPITWFVVAAIVFLVCCGGIVHNILHHAPLYGRQRNDQGEIEYEYISTGNREQYAMEGYIASFIMLVCGGTLIGLAILPKISQGSNVRFIGYILIIANMVAVFAIVQIYIMKTPWYGPTFMPPDDYIQGPLSNDQGNTI